MRLSHVSFVVISAPLVWTAAAHEVQVLGTSCNITGESAVLSDFMGMARVAAPPNGCTIDGRSDCYCGPLLNSGAPDEVDNSDWLWQCGDDVLFGPIDGKECPSSLPNGTCSTLIHPTGFEGDPGCGYSDCDSNATFSSVCGCIDLSLVGGDLNGGGDEVVWICLHSTCDCPEHKHNTTTSPGPTSMSHLTVSAISVSLVAMLVN